MNLKHFFSLSVEDLNKYYSETYMKINFNGENNFCYIYGFSSDNKGEKMISFCSSIGDKTRELTSIDYDFSFPSLGYYNYKDYTIMLIQQASKQWKKAICPTFFTIKTFHSEACYLVKCPCPFPRFYWDTNSINEVFNSSKSNIFSALHSVFKEETFSRAVSKDFCISSGVTSTAPQLWFMGKLIGTFLSKKTIRITNELFKEEAKDFFNPYSIEIK